MHQWMTDSGLTPHLMVDATVDAVDVPKAHVREGRIVLNVSYDATRHLDLGNDWVTFEARFGGVPRQLRFPTSAVQSIYARETGEGLMFPPEEDAVPPATRETVPEPLSDANPDRGPERGPDPGAGAGAGPDSPPPAPRGGGSRRPTLKVVK